MGRTVSEANEDFLPERILLLDDDPPLDEYTMLLPTSYVDLNEKDSS